MRNGLPQSGRLLGVMRQAMATDRLDPAGVYFGSSNGSLYASRGEGETWTSERATCRRSRRSRHWLSTRERGGAARPGLSSVCPRCWWRFVSPTRSPAARHNRPCLAFVAARIERAVTRAEVDAGRVEAVGRHRLSRITPEWSGNCGRPFCMARAAPAEIVAAPHRGPAFGRIAALFGAVERQESSPGQGRADAPRRESRSWRAAPLRCSANSPRRRRCDTCRNGSADRGGWGRPGAMTRPCTHWPNSG